MNISELYMTLEVYAHLRDLPQYVALRTVIEKTLREENDAAVRKPVVAVALKPAPIEPAEPVGFSDEGEVRR